MGRRDGAFVLGDGVWSGTGDSDGDDVGVSDGVFDGATVGDADGDVEGCRCVGVRVLVNTTASVYVAIEQIPFSQKQAGLPSTMNPMHDFAHVKSHCWPSILHLPPSKSQSLSEK